MFQDVINPFQEVNSAGLNVSQAKTASAFSIQKGPELLLGS